jgi:hypothetical protein
MGRVSSSARVQPAQVASPRSRVSGKASDEHLTLCGPFCREDVVVFDLEQVAQEVISNVRGREKVHGCGQV